jgi:CHAT domain-containing protein
LGNIGVVYHHLGNYPKALDYYQQDLKIRKEIGDKRGIGSDLTGIGVVYSHLGNYPKALDYYQQALKIKKEIGDKRGIGMDLGNIGNVHLSLGDPKALDYYQQALAIHKEIGDKDGIGRNLTNIGMVYLNLGDYPKALDYYQQALAIHKEIGGKNGIGNNLTNIGVVYLNLGDYPKALDYYQQALDIHKEIGDKRGIETDLTNIGLIYKNLGKYQKAKNAFQESLVIAKSIGVGETWKAQRGLASTEVKLNQPESAIQHYNQALNNIEKTRNLLNKEHKTSFMRDKIYVYDELIALLQSQHLIQPKKGYDRQAFKTFERKQGRLFLEEMGQSGARRFSGLDNKIVEAEESLIFKWKNLKSKPFTPQEYAVLEQEEVQLKNRIKEEYPKYYTLKYSQPVDLDTLQNQVLQKGEMMLVYGVIKDDPNPMIEIESKTILWVISKQHFQMFTLPVDEDTLEEKVAKLREYLSQPSFNSQFSQASMQLYQTLFPKAARKLIKDAEILYIVPTGPLYGLPFGALVTSYKPRRYIKYLIEDYAISYLSSASLLKTLREKERKQPPEQFLAFADPEYPPCDDGGEQKGIEFSAQLRTKYYLKSTKNGCFTPLAATADEVREIANLLNADSKALYLGSKATLSTLFALNKKQELDDYRYVMFSVHGILPNEVNQIQQPALVLSNPLTEGYLTMADVFNLKLNADFVNLSACNTGCADNSCSENVRGEGIMGLTRAFMYAGTSRVAVTLWSVNLYSAKDFSLGLFTNLKANKKMAHALREIKLKMIQGKASNRLYTNPYHWAAFVVYGDGQ